MCSSASSVAAISSWFILRVDLTYPAALEWIGECPLRLSSVWTVTCESYGNRRGVAKVEAVVILYTLENDLCKGSQ